jgi:hypothetical protein
MEATEVETEVSTWPHVELAYVEGKPGPPPAVKAADDPLSANQGYLSAAPAGIDAHFAWTEADGSGIGFVDLEQGWTLDHEDLPTSIPVIGPGSLIGPGIGQSRPSCWDHRGVDNDKGIVGITPHTSVSGEPVDEPAGQSHFRPWPSLWHSGNAKGDILLIGQQTPGPGFGWYRRVGLSSISSRQRPAASCLEPAGNNLENRDYTSAVPISMPSTPTVENSCSTARLRTSKFRGYHGRRCNLRCSTSGYSFSNYGSRVDCYAWGQNIATCGSFKNCHTLGPARKRPIRCTLPTSGAPQLSPARGVAQSWALKWLGVLSPSVLRCCPTMA